MNQIEKEFDEIFRNEGGIASDELYKSPIILMAMSYAEMLARKLEEQINKKDQSPYPFIYIDIIENSSLNTFVAQKNGNYFIGICKGTFLILSNIFFRMMSNKEVFPNIGDVSKEDDAERMYDAQVLNSEHLSDTPVEKLAPKDRERWGLAHVFIIQIMEFLIFHEFGHIAGGHMNYSDPNIKPVSVLEERLKELVSGYNPRQTLEIIADDFAIRTCLDGLYNSLNEGSGNKAMGDHEPDWPAILSVWLFPLCVFFRISGYRNYQYSLKDDQYPPPALRFEIILEIIADCLDQKYNFKEMEKLFTCFSDVAFNVEKAFDKISCQGLDSRTAKFVLKESVVTHRDKLLEDEINVAIFFDKHTAAYQNKRDSQE